jgi:hypothetical protein
MSNLNFEKNNELFKVVNVGFQVGDSKILNGITVDINPSIQKFFCLIL